MPPSEIGSTFMGASGPAGHFRVFFSADCLGARVLEDFPAFTPMALGRQRFLLAGPWRCADGFHCRKRAVYHGPIILETV
jgi:hypothetical protein